MAPGFQQMALLPLRRNLRTDKTVARYAQFDAVLDLSALFTGLNAPTTWYQRVNNDQRRSARARDRNDMQLLSFKQCLGIIALV
jgi:hypothetical protein